MRIFVLAIVDTGVKCIVASCMSGMGTRYLGKPNAAGADCSTPYLASYDAGGAGEDIAAQCSDEEEDEGGWLHRGRRVGREDVDAVVGGDEFLWTLFEGVLVDQI